MRLALEGFAFSMSNSAIIRSPTAKNRLSKTKHLSSFFGRHTLEMDLKMIPRFRHGSVQSFAVQGHLPTKDRLAEGDRDLPRLLVVGDLACQCAFDHLVRAIKLG